MPPVPTFCKFFVTVRHQPEANGLVVALYVFTLDQFQEVGLILFDCVHEMYEPRRSCMFWYKSFASIFINQIHYGNAAHLFVWFSKWSLKLMLLDKTFNLQTELGARFRE